MKEIQVGWYVTQWDSGELNGRGGDVQAVAGPMDCVCRTGKSLVAFERDGKTEWVPNEKLYRDHRPLMDYSSLCDLVGGVAQNTRLPFHDPADDDYMPCYPQAHVLAKLIASIDAKTDNRGLGAFDFGFGGAGDNGEYLIGILDVLMEVGIVKLDLEAAKRIASEGK